MTPDETISLLELLSAANVLNRLEDRTPDVWTAALADLEATDCTRAAAHLIRTRQWVKICDIRDTVAQIRADRITAANIVYDGNPDETGAQYAQSVRTLINAAACGQLPPRPIRAALEPAPDTRPVTGRVHAILTAVGHHVPAPRHGAINIFAVPCRICHAPAGRSCTSTTNLRRRRPDAHPTRLDDARRAAAGLPPADPETERRELEQRLDTYRKAFGHPTHEEPTAS